MARKRRRDQEKRHFKEVLPAAAVATAHVTGQYLGSPWRDSLLEQKYRWHTLFAETMETASSIATRTVHPDLFDTYVILGSRWLSHHQAIERLLTIGRYGDGIVLLRSLLEDTDLMTYFAYYPEDAKDWMERLSRGPDWSDKVYRQGIENFKPSQLWKQLNTKGVEPVGQSDYSILSATVHASP